MATAKIAPPLERQYYYGAEKHHVAGCNGMPRFVNGILFLIMLVSFLTVAHVQQAHPFRMAGLVEAQHFTVQVEMLVRKDGHVISAHGIAGPPEGYKACENAVKKQKFECGNN